MASQQEVAIAKAKARARLQLSKHRSGKGDGDLSLSEFGGIVGDAVVDAASGMGRDIDDFVRSVASGATFGYADEIAAGANAAIGSGDYESNIAAERERDASIPPSLAVPGQVLGGIATTVAAAPAAGATRAGQAFMKLPGYAKAIMSGAGYGGLYGSGNAEGSLPDRMAGAGGGAALGAATGGFLYPVARGIQAGAQGLTNLIQNRTAHPLAAQRKLLEALARDQSTPAKMQARLKQLGPQGTIADAGGENVLGLARAAAGTPGAAKNRASIVLNQRAEAEAARIGSKMKTTLKPKDYFGAQDQFLGNLKNNAADLYQEAYRAGPRIESKRLSSLLNRQIVKDAMNDAADLAGIEGRLVSRIDPDLTAQANMLISSGKMSRRDVPKGGIGRGVTTEAIDDLKRGLDSIIERETNALTGRLNKRGAAIANLKREILSEVDRLNPAYAKARAQYGGDAEVLGSLRDGRKFMRLDPEQITRNMAGMSKAAQESYRSGAARALMDIVDNTPDTTSAANRLFGKSVNRARIRAMFPDDASYNAFAKTLLAERAFTKTRNTVLGGSPTAPRLAEQSDMFSGIGDVAGLASGTGGGVQSAVRGLMSRATAPNPEVATQLSRMLFNRNQAMNQGLIDSLVKSGAKTASRKTVKDTAIRGLIDRLAQGEGTVVGREF